MTTSAQEGEQRRRVRQRVAAALDDGEEAVERRALRARLGCCRRLGHRRIVRNRAAARKLDPRSDVERRPRRCRSSAAAASRRASMRRA